MNRTKELVIILFLVGIISYIPSFFGGFVWDDEDFVYANTYVAELRIDKFFTENAIAGRGKTSNYYRPIQFSLYALLNKLGGLQPWLFHLAGILLHCITSVVVFLVLCILTGHRRMAFVASLFFLIHPVQTESVSYISGLSDQLYTFFFFASLLFFLKKERDGFFLPLSILFFILSLLSKELALIFPGILFLIVVFFKQKTIKRNMLYVSVFTLIALTYLILRFTVLQFMDISLSWKGNPYGQDITVRIATFFQNFWVYIGLLVFPKDLFMERDYSIKILTSVWNWWTLFFIAGNALLIFTLYFFSKKIKSLGKSLFFWLGFLVSLVPYTGIFLLNGIFYEHYLYLPMIFFWSFLFSLSGGLLKNKTVLWIIAGIVFVFIARSYARQWEWIDDERFYRQTLIHAPQSIRITNGLGMALANKGKCDEAIPVYKQTIALGPKVPNPYYNIARCYTAVGNTKEAESYFLKAIEVSPEFYYSYYALLKLYLDTKQSQKAKEFIEKKMFPRFIHDTQLKEAYKMLQS